MATQVNSTTDSGTGERVTDEPRPQPHLFRVFDSARPLAGAARFSLAGVDAVAIGRGPPSAERRREGQGQRLVLTIADGRVSSHHAALRRNLGRWLLEDSGSRNGTTVNGEIVPAAVLTDGDIIELGRTFFVFRDAVPVTGDDPADLDTELSPPPLPGLPTLSPAFARDLRALATIARSGVSVIIQGETGTGKEIVARATHAISGREGSFVAVNCGAIPDSLVESELFGVRRGAYSDAKEDRPGLVRSADGGTLFLDEIGDLPLSLQTAFLRVLQEREVVPIGTTRAVPVDVRVLSASHRRLDKLAETDGLRSDLWARLAGFTIELPPLRERREDMGLLVGALVRRLAPDCEKVSFQGPAVRLLLAHTWPRNVRELEKSLGAALVLAGDTPVSRQHLRDLAGVPIAVRRPRVLVESELDGTQRETLERLLDEHQGNLSAVARALGKDRVQVRRWLRRFNLDPARFK